MTPITDTKNLPPLRLGYRQQFIMHKHESLGEILSISRQKIARELAMKITEEDKFFSIKMDNDYGSLRTDIIVMTEQEYADLMREQFSSGVRHAQGLMPQWENT